ncbi:hypothetical protein ACFT5B_14725 [Luteimicrobium sp. NPDC057192]|uniref:hypothetical protein n=1 Tax=Luteimicrobium sp. NPDC057192 TaxID=3346042 RepID=UPI0036325A67
MDSATREADENLHTFPATVTTADGASEHVRIHNTFWAGVDWGLAHDSTVWFGLGSKEYGDPTLVMAAMVVTPDDVFFPGDCQDVSMTEPLHASLGARAHDVLASLPTTDSSKVDALLGLEPAPTPSGPTILNPQDASQELLDSLSSVALRARITDPLGKGETSPSLCTHIAEGWGDCVMTDDSTVEGVDFSAYANTRGEVEVWLLDGNADVTQPIGYLGSITLPPTRSDTSPDKLASHTVELVVDTSNLDLSSLPDTAVTTEANKGRVTFSVVK